MQSNLQNLEKAMKNGALGNKNNHHNSKSPFHTNLIKGNKNNVKGKTTKSESKLHKTHESVSNNSRENDKKNNKVINHTKHKISLKEYNQELRPANRIQSSLELRNEFANYPIMPDLFSYCMTDAKNRRLPLNKEIAILQLLTHSNGISTNSQRNLSLLRNTQAIHLQIPTYISRALKDLTSLINHIKENKANYTSLSNLRKLVIHHEDDFKFNINKSSVLMLLLMGLIKPDAKLKQHLLNNVTKNKPALAKLIQTGYLIPTSSKSMSYTTASVPLDLSLWFNLAEVKMMHDFSERNQNNFVQIQQSCEFLRGIDGGKIISFNTYLSSFTNLINFKLQALLLTK